MDALRGAAVLAVIAWHVVSVPSLFGLPMHAWIHTAFELLEPVRMPLMFVLSGMLLPHALTKPWSAYAMGKLRNILWPYAVWMVLTCAALGSLASLTAPWTLIGGAFHLWFLAVLLACFALGVVTRWVPPLLLAAAMLATLWLGDFSTHAVNRFLYWGAFFFLGAALWRHRDAIAGFRPWFPVVTGILGVACLAFTSLTTSDWDEELTVLSFAVRVPWMLTALWIGPRLPRLPRLEWVGRNSIVFYLVHFAVIGMLARPLIAAGAPTALVYAAGTVVGFGAPWSAAHLRPRIAWLFAAPRFRRAPAA